MIGVAAYVTVWFRRTDAGDSRDELWIAGWISDSGLDTTAAAAILVKAVDNKVNMLKHNIFLLSLWLALKCLMRKALYLQESGGRRIVYGYMRLAATHSLLSCFPLVPTFALRCANT